MGIRRVVHASGWGMVRIDHSGTLLSTRGKLGTGLTREWQLAGRQT